MHKRERAKNQHRLIYFAGVDGCGKSSIIDEIIKEYGEKGIKSRRVWLRFNYMLTRPVLLFCRLTGLTRRVEKGGKVYSIHDFHTSKTIAFIVQYLHLIDTYIAYFRKVWVPLKFTNDVILCDKFVYDILADFMVETRDISLLNKKITSLFIRMLPENMDVILISVDKDEIIKRKPSVLIDDEDYDFKYDIYKKIERTFEFTIVKNADFDVTLRKVREILEL